MHSLASHISGFDPEAGAALRVVSVFDALGSDGAGIVQILKAVSSVASAPVRFNLPTYGINLRVGLDGTVARSTDPPDPSWPCAPLDPGGVPALWLERSDAHSLVHRMVLDRAPRVMREVLRRTRGPLDSRTHAEYVEILIDSQASEQDRLRAARRLKLPIGGPVWIVLDDKPTVETVSASHARCGRTGIGPAGAVLELPISYERAKIARAFAADGTDSDPGSTVVEADDLGVLPLLAAGLDDGPVPPDIRALDAIASTGLLPSLHAVIVHTSLRTAAAAMHLHHSTLQARIAGVERELGWSLRSPAGRLRLHLAFSLRRYLLHSNENE